MQRGKGYASQPREDKGALAAHADQDKGPSLQKRGPDGSAPASPYDVQGTGLSASAVLQKYVQPEAGTTSRISTRGERAILSSFTVSPSTPSSGEKAQCQDSLIFFARGIAG